MPFATSLDLKKDLEKKLNNYLLAPRAGDKKLVETLLFNLKNYGKTGKDEINERMEMLDLTYKLYKKTIVNRELALILLSTLNIEFDISEAKLNIFAAVETEETREVRLIKFSNALPGGRRVPVPTLTPHPAETAKNHQDILLPFAALIHVTLANIFVNDLIKILEGYIHGEPDAQLLRTIGFLPVQSRTQTARLNFSASSPKEEKRPPSPKK